MDTPKSALSRETFDRCMDGYDIGNTTRHTVLDRINAALEREQAVLRQQTEVAVKLAIENHEAELCPEDFGCKEYIASLQNQLAALRREVVEECASVEHIHPIADLIKDTAWRKGYVDGRSDMALAIRALADRAPKEPGK